MEEMWLARDKNGELFIFIDDAPPVKKAVNGWVNYSLPLLRFQDAIFVK